jgi:hypothetical protein
MPYELGTIWNVTSKYIYNTLDKNIGIGTTTPICELDVYCNIAENGIKLEDKYQLKPENNKKYDLIVREDLDEDYSHPNYLTPIIWYKFNRENFTSNYDIQGRGYGTLSTENGTISNLQKEYYVGTGSAEINNELYYKIHMSANQFTQEKCTFCFWLFLNEECISDRFILNLKDTTSDIFYFKYATDKLTIYKTDTAYIEYYDSLDKNKWHHITIIIDDTSVPEQRTLLIDGIPINSNLTGTIPIVLRGGNTATANIYLGNTIDSINGYIDDFRIYESNLPIHYIQNNIIGKITKITPGNISANGNYGIDIVNYSNLINVGTENSNVDLTIYGDLTVISNFNINSIDIVDATFQQITATNITATSITENDKTLINKYALIGSIDKNTDIIVSKMIDSDDVDALYGEMPAYFRSNLIVAYNFDYNFDNIDNSNEFFRNRSYDENSLWYTYNITPIIEKEKIIDYYGTKYVKGNASLHCYSNADGIHYYNFRTISENDATFHKNENYTISFWIRLNGIDETQNIFKIGGGSNKINLKLNDDNKLVFINENDSLNGITVNNVSFKKDEWYHICIILKNIISVNVTRNDFQDDDYDKLIEQFTNLKYSSNPSVSDTIQFENQDRDPVSQNPKTSVFIYINGIKYKDHTYNSGIDIFYNAVPTDNFIGVENDQLTTDYLNGFIDDFKIFKTIVPIQYINKHIIGDALVIKPGQLSAIGNYGINIENFNNLVSIGQENTNVNLNIYGLLNVVNDTIQFSNIQIDAIENVLSTSNITVTNILNTNSNISSNITVSNSIVGDGFILGSSSNYISNITIDHLSNTNLNSCNITADIITVTNELILGDAKLSNINIVGINIDDTFSISNNKITILRYLIIGDTNCNAYRYDLGEVESTTKNKININNSNFSHYYTYGEYFPTIKDTDDIQIQVFDKSIIFYGNTEQQNYDIHFKNNYIRDEYCNIQDEISESYGDGHDRDRTRIKLDVGNIRLQNGFIELIEKDILTKDEPSTLKIEENQISITSNHNTTILSDSLMLSNANNYCLLTNSNFLFNNVYGFTDNETLKINKIKITEELEINKINTSNTVPDTISIDTSNASIIGKIRGHLCSNSIINITDEIKTTCNITGSNITGSNITADDITITHTLHTSNIICEYEITFKEPSLSYTCNTIIKKDRIEVNDLHISGGITLGQQTGSADNSINGGFGSLSINTIRTTNTNSDDISIDTSNQDIIGKIRGFLSSNSKIDITGEIKTESNITGSNITANDITINDTLDVSNINTSNITANDITINDTLNVSNINTSNITANDITINDTLNVSNIRGSNNGICSIIGKLEGNSIININCNITTRQDIHCENQFTSNTLYASNIQSIDGDLCSIEGKLNGDSKIDITGEIKTESNITGSNLYALYISAPPPSVLYTQQRCCITGKLTGDSEIEIDGHIKGDDLHINTIYARDSSEIIFINNDTSNAHNTKCNNLKVHHISKLDSTNNIEIHNNIIIKSANNFRNDADPYIILTDSNITVYEKTNNYFKLEGNKISYKSGASIESNIIYYDTDELVIECDKLIVTKFDFNKNQFEFDNIITYSHTEQDWPNIYIGNTTDDTSRQNERQNNQYLDVLYVDTPGDSRLKTGNILIQKKLSIDDEFAPGEIKFEITTKEAFTFFKNHNEADLLVFSLQNKSIGINTKPPDNTPNIKLFVKDGGIQTTGDIIAFANISDKRFKMNITSFNNNDGIDIINKLNPVKFRWKADLFNTKMANKDDIGFIAQEVAEIIPEAVAKCKIEMNEIDYNYINYERIIPYLVNNIKYLNNKIVELEDKLNGI